MHAQATHPQTNSEKVMLSPDDMHPQLPQFTDCIHVHETGNYMFLSETNLQSSLQGFAESLLGTEQSPKLPGRSSRVVGTYLDHSSTDLS